jgi:hypothetical protein
MRSEMKKGKEEEEGVRETSPFMVPQGTKAIEIRCRIFPNLLSSLPVLSQIPFKTSWTKPSPENIIRVSNSSICTWLKFVEREDRGQKADRGRRVEGGGGKWWRAEDRGRRVEGEGGGQRTEG